jgi:RNA polymerase sigma factor (TIGR02999 family)
MPDLTHLLIAIENGDAHAADKLLPLVYDELRQLAAGKLNREKPGQTLQATALVHEAYLRLVGTSQEPHWNGRGHFFAAAAEAMRRILVEKARHKQRIRHGGQVRRADFDEPAAIDSTQELLDLDDALAKLAAEDAPAADLAKLHIFAGFSIEDAANLIGISRATAYRHWEYAKAWLRCEMIAANDQAR